MNTGITRLTHWAPSKKGVLIYLTLAVAGYLIWLGLLKATAVEHKNIEFWLGNSPILKPLLENLGVQLVSILMLVLEVLTGLLILLGLRHPRLGIVGGSMAMSIFALNFLYLFTNPVWIESMGGFPFLSSGQGIIKYLSMFAVAAAVVVLHLEQTNQYANIDTLKKYVANLCIAGVALVMGWIGWFKFFLFEAEGIVTLMESNFLFSWTYQVWDVQGASNFIGIMEWLFLLLLCVMPWNKTLGKLGVLGIAATAFGTLSFVFSVPGWHADSYFPLLNNTGIFIIKDQLLLAAAVFWWHYHCEK